MIMSGGLWNPWHGCRKCSPGCLNCYVFYLDGQRGIDAGVVTRSKTNFDMPLRKDRHGNYKVPSGAQLATCFTSDFFLEDADGWRDEAWGIIRSRPDVDFLICTKRIERFEAHIPDDWNEGYSNVAIAVTCENQQKADERMPELLRIKARRKYVFVAPILEYVDLTRYLSGGGVDMVSVGGESYAGARTCDFEWVKQIYTDCAKYGVPFDFHQTGSNFVMNGRRYKIRHRDEYSQAKKGMKYLSGLLSEKA